MLTLSEGNEYEVLYTNFLRRNNRNFFNNFLNNLLNNLFRFSFKLSTERVDLVVQSADIIPLEVVRTI